MQVYVRMCWNITKISTNVFPVQRRSIIERRPIETDYQEFTYPYLLPESVL